MALTIASDGMRDLFVQEWLACTLRTYPDQTGRFLRQERDPFRNPVGHTLRVALTTLGEELFGDFDRARVTASLDAVVRIRAVQAPTPSEAVRFVFLARDAARAVAVQGGPGLAPGSLDLLEARIDEAALIAFDLFARCREQILAIGARAARRRVYVLERAQRLESIAAPDEAGDPFTAPGGGGS
jgi:hypothetical protein